MKKRERHNNPRKPTLISDIVIHLPEDIITEILIFLPVKTLIKFRCVCKSWICLITNPRFVETHLIKSSNPANYTHQKLILNDRSTTLDRLYSCSVRDTNWSNEIHSLAHLSFPVKVPVLIAGSCNGLLCVHNGGGRMFIWNPSTRKYKELPMYIEFPCYNVMNFGFGYDQLNDDYKVLRIHHHNPGEYGVMIYSLKNNSWGKIRSFPHYLSWNGPGKYVSGVVYWLKTNSDIVYFDLGNETTGELSKPCYDKGIVSHMLLGVFDGFLCASCTIDRACIDTWVLKEHGVSYSWVKIFTVPYWTYLHFCDIYSPLYIFKTGKILLKSESHLVIFNPKNRTYRYVENFLRQGMWLEAMTYIESLVSPNLDDGEEPSQQN